jgi:hypothetical protein
MGRANLVLHAFFLLSAAIASHAYSQERELLVGIAGHAFDHDGEFSDQGPTAAACGVNILYGGGFGTSYTGLKTPAENAQLTEKTAAYLQQCHHEGIKLGIGYICATSIVKLDQFDHDWTPEFRKQFTAPVSEWLQCDSNGKPLPSWYGGDYRPACMNNPNWRTFEKSVVRLQLEAGFNGIFFDNPTVHPQGCYCEYCMKRFATFASDHGLSLDPKQRTSELRQAAVKHPELFQQFRGTIASDFIADMRRFARTVKPNALVTCNNSFNAPNALFSQCRTFGHDIFELSKAEDWVLVEDMQSQPRVRSDGSTVEYAPEYEGLAAISHGKPVVAITIVDGNYRTAPNLTRLAMAEAAAHGASYLSWPNWPPNLRKKLIDGVKPEADFLKQHADLLNGGHRRADVIVFMPFRQWVHTDVCRPLQWAAALSAANIPYLMASEDDLTSVMTKNPHAVLLAESPKVLIDSETAATKQFESAGGHIVWVDETKQNDWLPRLQKSLGTPSVVMHGPPTMRITLTDQPGKCIAHLLNLNVLPLSSYDDKVTPAGQVDITLHVPFSEVHGVKAETADPDAAQGNLHFDATPDAHGEVVKVSVPKTVLSTMLVVQ